MIHAVFKTQRRFDFSKLKSFSICFTNVFNQFNQFTNVFTHYELKKLFN